MMIKESILLLIFINLLQCLMLSTAVGNKRRCASHDLADGATHRFNHLAGVSHQPWSQPQRPQPYHRYHYVKTH
ncbi:hypothetical protein PanWU01x14_251370 [Parasponia andersonii]|uniref:Transmembrane protein n=1 Tax=Parasponia andersonii TaxID=3476 RepID=A0A2P5BCK1_PARAD|nr:hypothetical protein PanWU01x14_251370 [Parasponia andersonii]